MSHKKADRADSKKRPRDHSHTTEKHVVSGGDGPVAVEEQDEATPLSEYWLVGDVSHAVSKPANGSHARARTGKGRGGKVAAERAASAALAADASRAALAVWDDGDLTAHCETGGCTIPMMCGF